MKKKVLILSMSGGFGHVKAGQALLEYAKKNRPDLDVEHIDISDMSPLLKKISVTFYNTASKKIPFLWAFAYNLLDVKVISWVFKKIGGVNSFTSNRIKNYIYQKNPDAIIFTNVVPLPIFNSAFHKKLASTPMGVVVTDYHAHSYYYFPWLDYYFAATGQVAQDLEKLGVKKEKIVVSGIPISEKFYLKVDIGSLKLKYGIQNDLPIVLLIASFRISGADLVKVTGQLLDLTPKVNLVLVTSGNEEFYDIIKNNFATAQNLLLVKWTDTMDEYMKMADVVISKAGGLTVSECLALQKPLVMINPIPGQEERNAEYVQENHFGVRVNRVGDIIGALPDMIASSHHRQMDLVVQENPSKKIFQYILKQ